MTQKRLAKQNNNLADVHYSHWAAQMITMISPRCLDIIAGRGSAKTTEILVNQLKAIIYDMPGAPIAWVSDTYQNLKQNVLPMIFEALERKGFVEGVHFVVEKAPPLFSRAEVEGLEPWLQPHFWKPYNHIVSYKHTIIFFTGTNITFGSLDRPASLAGRSYVYVFGDEAKYFKQSKIANILKAVRGYELQFGSSTYYRGHCFTTDMPNPDNIGEYDWIVRQGQKMEPDAIKILLQCALIVNEIKSEVVSLCFKGDEAEARKRQKLLSRWESKLYQLRRDKRCHNLFLILSSFVNVDILSVQWFIDAIDSGLKDVNTAILSCLPSLSSGERFYAQMADSHFYRDGNKDDMFDEFSLLSDENCRILKHLQPSKPLEVGVDFGNMHSMVVGQPIGECYYLLKTIYTLSPEWLRELADKFLTYFAPHPRKTVHLYYDRAGNNLRSSKQDSASKLKEYLEYDGMGKRTGWSVVLMSLGQANIPQSEEYDFMHELFSSAHKQLPVVKIDYYNCKPLRCSLELARTRRNSKGLISKDKRSERLPIEQLPYYSTNFSDSFKYLMMRPKWRQVAKARRTGYTGANVERSSAVSSTV